MGTTVLQFKVIQIRDSQLQRKIAEWSRITGRTIKEETRTAFRSMVRMALTLNPPASNLRRGREAKTLGELSIGRDLKRMGFAPRDLKGKKIYTKTFWGHVLTKPLEIPTKENPKFAEPDAFHLLRLLAKHAGKVSRGGTQAFYVDRRKFKTMLARLLDEVGRLSSGWINAANQLGVSVPAWIARHGGARGSNVEISETEHRVTMRVVNRYPATATNEAGEMRRRIDIFKKYEIGNLARQIKANLGRNLRRVR